MKRLVASELAWRKCLGPSSACTGKAYGDRSARFCEACRILVDRYENPGKYTGRQEGTYDVEEDERVDPWEEVAVSGAKSRGGSRSHSMAAAGVGEFQDAQYAAQKKAKLLVGSNVKRLREAAGLSQGNLAARVGVSRGLIAKIEGGYYLNDRKLVDLAIALQVPVTDFYLPLKEAEAVDVA